MGIEKRLAGRHPCGVRLPGASVSHIARLLLEILLAPRADRRVDAFAGECKRDGLTNALAAACNEHRFAAEIEVHLASIMVGAKRSLAVASAVSTLRSVLEARLA